MSAHSSLSTQRELSMKQPQLSPRELAVTFTDTQIFFVSEPSFYRVQRSHKLGSPQTPVHAIHLNKMFYGGPLATGLAIFSARDAVLSRCRKDAPPPVQ